MDAMRLHKSLKIQWLKWKRKSELIYCNRSFDRRQEICLEIYCINRLFINNKKKTHKKTSCSKFISKNSRKKSFRQYFCSEKPFLGHCFLQRWNRNARQWLNEIWNLWIFLCRCVNLALYIIFGFILQNTSKMVNLFWNLFKNSR